MKVKRIVVNVRTADIAAAAAFYRDVLGLELVMDLGWIATYGTGTKTTPQISFASEGGAGTPTPDLSIEVDDVDAALSRAKAAGYAMTFDELRFERDQRVSLAGLQRVQAKLDDRPLRSGLRWRRRSSARRRNR